MVIAAIFHTRVDPETLVKHSASLPTPQDCYKFEPLNVKRISPNDIPVCIAHSLVVVPDTFWEQLEVKEVSHKFSACPALQ